MGPAKKKGGNGTDAPVSPAKKRTTRRNSKQQMNDSEDPKEVDKSSPGEVKCVKTLKSRVKSKQPKEEKVTHKKTRTKKNGKKDEETTSEYFEEKGTKNNQKRSVPPKRKAKDVPVKRAENQKNKKKKKGEKDDNLHSFNVSADSIEHSDSDFDTTSSQIEKPEKLTIDSSSSDSDFEDVEEPEASTSGYNSKLSTSSASESCTKPVDFSQVDQENFNISMLAKIEGVQLQKDMESEDNEDDSDWEKVEEGPSESPVKSQLPSGPVEITLDAPDIMRKKRKKKGFDIEAWFRRKFNRLEKETQLTIHKVHLLCLLARGMYVNQTICNNEELQAHALSHIPQEFISRPVDKHNVHALLKLIQWFNNWLSMESDLREPKSNLRRTLVRRMLNKNVASVTELTYICVALLRSMGFNTRLVLSLQPVSHKPRKVLNIKKKMKEAEADAEDKKAEEDGEEIIQLDGPSDEPVNKKKKSADGKSQKKIKSAENSKSAKINDSAKNTRTQVKSMASKNSAKKDVNIPGDEKQTKTDKLKLKSSKAAASKVDKVESTTIIGSQSTGERKRRRSCTSKLNANVYTVDDDSETDNAPKESKRLSAPKGKGKGKSTAKKKVGKEDPEVSIEEISSDSDFEDEVMKLKRPTSLVKKKAAKRKHKIVSSDSDQSLEILKSKISEPGCDIWLEVYLAAEEKWICVDCVRAKVNQPRHIEDNASKPITFVLAYDNDGCVKDVTKRYASNWLSHTRKLRVHEEWWTEALEPFRPLNANRDEQEDLKLQAMLLQKPLPTIISEFKNHPLYALKRHLLKFEAIYPDTAVPLGFVKKTEPVYARECVHTLHTRETWLKEGRSVRVGETPYKVVKGRKKWNRTYEADEEPECEIFGHWQTEIYMPPPAVDGKIPRNEYGNVEMFQPWMLPIGTVHLKDGLNKVARKLDIDCAPAMIGWDFHSGFTHPMFDGFIVCEEHKDVLLAAWDEEQEIQREKEAEKKEKRVLSNWKTLIRGLLIKERLKSRFDLDDKSKAEDVKEEPDVKVEKTQKATKKKNKRQTNQKAGDMEVSWPQNRMDSLKPSKSTKSELFPFEQI